MRWYIRSSRDGRIVNAVEGTGLSRARAEEIAAEMTGGPYFVDDNPPLPVLEQYEYWSRRP